MLKLFTAHPASVDESYTEHMAVAASFGARMVLAGIACFIHALVPFLFERTGSSAITQLHERMVTHRRPSETAQTSLQGASRGSTRVI